MQEQERHVMSLAIIMWTAVLLVPLSIEFPLDICTLEFSWLEEGETLWKLAHGNQKLFGPTFE